MHLVAGPQDAVAVTPPRAPGSVRRTTSLDVSRPDGLGGPVVADIRGRDVHTDADGHASVLGQMALTVEIDQLRGQIVAVRGAPPGHPPAALVGTPVRGGFARRLVDVMPDEATRRTLLYSVLDDLNGAFLVAGYALLRNGLLGTNREQSAQRAAAQADVCIGWANGGPVVELLRETGVTAVPIGPAAPVIDAGDDPLGWHPMAPLVPETVRRRRRLDVMPQGGALLAQSHFRDSYAGPDGETVMHEYVVDARFDEHGRLADLDVHPQVLPWDECPNAAWSAHRLLGAAVEELPARVRDLDRVETCTHLNSTLRALADVRALAPDPTGG